MCDKEFKDKYALGRYKRKQENKKVICQKCLKLFRDLISIQGHAKYRKKKIFIKILFSYHCQILNSILSCPVRNEQNYIQTTHQESVYLCQGLMYNRRIAIQNLHHELHIYERKRVSAVCDAFVFQCWTLSYIRSICRFLSWCFVTFPLFLSMKP